jgi:tetratricopeptide (TPR) repeat protein
VHQEDENVSRRLSAHPAEVDLLALATGRDADAREEAHVHVGGCPACARRTASLRTLADAVELESILEDELEAAAPHAETPRGATGRARLARLVADADAAQCEVDGLLDLARDARADLAGRVRILAASGGGRLTLLYAAQRGAFAAAVPTRALALAEAIEAAARGPELPAQPGARSVPSALLRAEARLLASQALLNIGRLRQAREAVVAARPDFETLGDDPFSRALCDYFEASVLSFQGEFAPAERLFKAAARVFADFAQDHWVGRAEGMLGVILVQRGNYARALAAFDTATERLDPERDANAFAAALLSRARCLSRLSRFEAAQQGFAQALQVARRHRLDALVFSVRQNLAALELLRGNFEKALASYRAVSKEADRLGLEEDQVVTRLGAAECLGRLGRTDDMMDALRDVGRLVAVTDLAGNPAWATLAARLDPGDVDVGLVSEVRVHLEAARDGFVLPFRAAKRA